MWTPDEWGARLLVRYIRASGHPGKLRLIGWLCRLFRPRGLRFRSDTGASLSVDPADFIGWAICVHGAYEPRTLARARALMADGGTFVDVGANIGLFTAYLSVLPTVTVVSIEPNPDVRARLEANVAENGGTRVTVVDVAVADRDGAVTFDLMNGGNSGRARVHSADALATGRTITVPARRLDRVLTEAGARGVTLLKMDVEGFELPALRGLDWTGRFRPRDVIIEVQRLQLTHRGGRAHHVASVLRRAGVPRADDRRGSTSRRSSSG